MRTLPAALLAALLSLAPAVLDPAAAQTCVCAGQGGGVAIRSDEAPPPLPDYDQPPMPGPGYLWTPGYWAWNTYEYYWVPGTWAEPPRPGLLWTPGYWAFVDGVYGFHPGYWGQHVGFYGGVVYGYGYGGVGYEGGYWNGDRFFYNRVVNNFGAVRVENVYEKAVILVSPSAERASFNGPGGSPLRPTAEEEAFAGEARLPPTKLQVDHARIASRTGDLFESSNHGRPAIAATAAPTAFSGPGVVRAKAGGAPFRRVNETPPGAGAPKLAPSPEPTPSTAPQIREKAPSGEPPKVIPSTGVETPKPPPSAGPAPGPKASPTLVPEMRGPHPANEPESRFAPVPRPEKAPPLGEPRPAPGGAAGPSGGPVHLERRAPGAEPAPGRPSAHPAEGKAKCGGPDEPKCP